MASIVQTLNNNGTTGEIALSDKDARQCEIMARKLAREKKGRFQSWMLRVDKNDDLRVISLYMNGDGLQSTTERGKGKDIPKGDSKICPTCGVHQDYWWF